MFRPAPALLRRPTTCLVACLCSALLLASANGALAGPLRDRIAERMRDKQGQLDVYQAQSKPTATVSYGSDPAQRFDVYVDASIASNSQAPVIFMVHGGGWRRGDKDARGVVDNKFQRWGPRGIVFISTNYRMLPDADPYVQAQDVARALAKAQADAARWGADPRRFVLMGHSAGAHLVALLAASPELLSQAGALPPLGTVSLDSGTLDVVDTMENRHLKLYDQAFGKDKDFWLKVSPLQVLAAKPAPMQMVCSTRRRESCPQARKLAAKIKSLGGNGEVLGEDLSHGEINMQLGLPGAYTAAVEAFLSQLDPALAQRLRAAP